MDTESITLGHSDLHLLPLGVGTMTWGKPALRHRFHPAQLAYGPSLGPDEERNAVEASLSAGVTLFDTAEMYSYGASEQRLGELTRDKDVMIATKFPEGFLFPRAENLPGALQASLRRLQRKRIDLYQVHYPFQSLSIPKVMELMADEVGKGTISALGVSNFTAEQMRSAHEILQRRGIPLASNQVQYSLLYRKPEVDGVMDVCRELGITLIAYMPLAMGALTGKYTPRSRPRGLRRLMKQFRRKELEQVVPVVDLLNEIGLKYTKSAAQVALRWLIQQGDVVPIPGAKTGQQAAHNAGALGFRLSGQEMEALSQATIRWRSK